MALKRERDTPTCSVCSRHTDNICCWKRCAAWCSLSCCVELIRGEKAPTGCNRTIIRYLWEKLLRHVEKEPPFASGVLGKPSVAPGNLKELIQLCEIAPVGKGVKTVYDTNVRKVLQVRDDQVKVDWPDLPLALENVQKTLCPHVRLRAELYKVLVYRPGDFFKYHVDSKKNAQHIITLCVDTGIGGEGLEGGALRFRDTMSRHSDELDEDEPDGAEWNSEGVAGSYCAWFASSSHSLKPVERGHRVVAVYNVMHDGIVNVSKNVGWLPRDNATPISWVGQHVGQNIIKFLDDTKALVNLSLTCKAMHGAVGDVLERTMISLGPFLKKMLAGRKLWRLGSLMSHRYSLDGRDAIEPWELHGRDASLFRTLKTIFNVSADKVKIVPCHVSLELQEDIDIPTRCRVGPAVITREEFHGNNNNDNEYYEDEDIFDIPKQYRQFFNGKSKIDGADLYFLQSTFGEMDDRLPYYFVPFFGTHFVATTAWVSKYFTNDASLEGSVGPLWGNGATFEIYWYRDCAVIMDLDDNEETQNELRWGEDIVQYNY